MQGLWISAAKPGSNPGRGCDTSVDFGCSPKQDGPPVSLRYHNDLVLALPPSRWRCSINVSILVSAAVG